MSGGSPWQSQTTSQLELHKMMVPCSTSPILYCPQGQGVALVLLPTPLIPQHNIPLPMAPLFPCITVPQAAAACSAHQCPFLPTVRNVHVTPPCSPLSRPPPVWSPIVITTFSPNPASSSLVNNSHYPGRTGGPQYPSSSIDATVAYPNTISFWIFHTCPIRFFST